MLQLLNLFLKFPFRMKCRKKGHVLSYRKGYWGCVRCGIRSKDNYKSLKEKGMLYKPKN